MHAAVEASETALCTFMAPQARNNHAHPRFFLLGYCRSRTRIRGDAVVGFGKRTSNSPCASKTFDSSGRSAKRGAEGKQIPRRRNNHGPAGGAAAVVAAAVAGAAGAPAEREGRDEEEEEAAVAAEVPSEAPGTVPEDAIMAGEHEGVLLLVEVTRLGAAGEPVGRTT